MIESASVIAAIAIVVTMAAGVLAFEARAAKSRTRERELEAAVVALRSHYRALELLDDEATPLILLERALSLSEAVHDHEFAQTLAMILKRDPAAFAEDRPAPDSENEFFEAMQIMRKKRPDLALAFHNSVLTGIAAFVLRWPECSKAFPTIMINVATEPTEDAVRAIGNVFKLTRKQFPSATPPGDGPVAMPA